MAAQPLFVSSGDLVADRRYQWALDYLQRGDPPPPPTSCSRWWRPRRASPPPGSRSARSARRLGDRDGAIAAFAAARDADREDYHGARLHLARLGVGEATPAMTGVYVRRLFDQYAPRFRPGAGASGSTIAGRSCCSTRCGRRTASALRFGSVLDLGCGTGLGGAAFRPHCDWLVGVDISPGMVEQARAKGLYDRLVVGELAGVPRRRSRRRTHHLVLAADVFVYCSDLAPIAAAVASVLAPGGLFAFTVETHDGAGVTLQQTLRYAHGAAHVRDAMPDAGLDASSSSADVSTRTEKGAPVPGLLVVASTPPSSPIQVRARTANSLGIASTVDDDPRESRRRAAAAGRFSRWFASRGWAPRAHQLELLARRAPAARCC